MSHGSNEEKEKNKTQSCTGTISFNREEKTLIAPTENTVTKTLLTNKEVDESFFGQIGVKFVEMFPPKKQQSKNFNQTYQHSRPAKMIAIFEPKRMIVPSFGHLS